jgi:hypothetical protein
MSGLIDSIPVGQVVFGTFTRPDRGTYARVIDGRELAPRWVSSVLALAVAQPCGLTEDLG